ncbi:response regulator transcription factor [Jeotgalibacillus marinus]|uniref:Response regulator transcription factor n=1 Tax=Jeotgalibacillus marinus TaxID=86667 RepID=A0ABV3Q526_9BACL
MKKMYKILVVEDNLYIQNLVMEFLESQHYHVEVANDGEECLKKYQNNNFDLIILDIMLPKMDGFQICQMIRKKSSIPIILLTALGDEFDQLRGFELGIDDYITKPFSFNILVNRVKAVLRRTYQEDTKKMVFEDLNIDVDAHKIYIDNVEIELTTKEFELIILLVKNQDKVVTRRDILQQLWEYDYHGDTRVIDTHIKNIRKKIDRPYIKTVKGVGYILEK